MLQLGDTVLLRVSLWDCVSHIDMQSTTNKAIGIESSADFKIGRNYTRAFCHIIFLHHVLIAVIKLK